MEHSKAAVTKVSCLHSGEHQMELLDCVAAKFHEEPGVFKLLVYHKCCGILMTFTLTIYPCDGNSMFMHRNT